MRLEAMLGAICLDQGFLSPMIFKTRCLSPIDNGFRVEFKDHKSQLQGTRQADSNRSIHYKMVHEEGPAHHRIFTVEVYMDNILMGVSKEPLKERGRATGCKRSYWKRWIMDRKKNQVNAPFNLIFFFVKPPKSGLPQNQANHV